MFLLVFFSRTFGELVSDFSCGEDVAGQATELPALEERQPTYLGY